MFMLMIGNNVFKSEQSNKCIDFSMIWFFFIFFYDMQYVGSQNDALIINFEGGF